MAAYYRSIGSSLKQRLEEIYTEYGRYLNVVDSFEFPGLTGMDKMAGIMQELRDNPPAAMPAGATTTILASKYDCEEEFSVKLVVFSTAASLLTTPIWSLILMKI